MKERERRRVEEKKGKKRKGEESRTEGREQRRENVVSF